MKRKLATDKYPRYYYHISREKLHNGDFCCELEPLSSDNIKIQSRGPEEPTIPRICVAPSIPNCLSAIQFFSGFYYCYRTLNKTKAKYPYDVPDVNVTLERWFIEKTKFVLAATLDLGKFHEHNEKNYLEDIKVNVYCGSYEELESQREVKEIWKDLLKKNECSGLVFLIDDKETQKTSVGDK